VSPAPVTPGEFSGKIQGRDGLITYREAPQELQIHWEVSGSPRLNVLVSPDFRRWPSTGEVIPEERQLQLLGALRDWLKAQNFRSDIDLPSDTSEDESGCLWAGCGRHRLKQYYYCRRHFDLSCLVGALSRRIDACA
jgi:hypothetical protein